MTAPSLGLVVPLFDEEVRFAEYGKSLVEFGATACGPGSSLVFVDDGSTDRTASLAAELVASSAPPVDVRLLRRPHLGKGAAVAAGLASVIAAGRADYAAFCDLDLSTPLDELLRIVEAARAGDVLAIGSRDLAGSRLVQRESPVRETLGRAYNRLLQATVTPGIVDTQCGAKAASCAVWSRVLPFCRETGFAWDAEAVAVALALGIEVQEVAIEWRHDPRTKIRVGADGLAMVLATPRIMRSVLTAGSRQIWRDPAVKTGWRARAEAALIATALKRSGAAKDGVLAAIGSGDGAVTAMLGWAPDRVVADHGRPAVRAGAAGLPLAAGSAAVVCLLDGLDGLPEARRVLRRDGGRLIVWSADKHAGRRVAASGFRVLWSSRVLGWQALPTWVGRRQPWLAQRLALVLTAAERSLLGRVRSPVGAATICVAEAR